MVAHPTIRPANASPIRRRLSGVDILDGAEVAQLLHLPISTVLDFARRGVLPGRKLGRRWIFLRDELEAVVRAAPTAHEPDRPLSPHGLKRYPKAVPSAQSSSRLETPA